MIQSPLLRNQLTDAARAAGRIERADAAMRSWQRGYGPGPAPLV